MNQKAILAHMAMIVTTMIYALNYTIAKEIMPEPFDSSTLVLIRLLVASAIFFLIYKIFVNEKFSWRENWKTLVVASFTGVVINTLLFFKGLSLSQPIDASIIMSLTPILTFVIAVIIKTETATKFNIAGVALSFAGVYSLVTQFTFKVPVISFGNFLLLLNATAYAVYLVHIKNLTNQLHPLTVTFYTFLLALPFVSVAGASGILDIGWLGLTKAHWWALFFVVIFVTVITYLLIVFSAKQLTASSLGFYNYLQPVFAILFALGLGSDSISFYEVVGIFVVLTGLALVNKKNNPPSPAMRVNYMDHKNQIKG